MNQINKTVDLIVIEPVSFLDMIQLERSASLIITDSGGVQKEDYFFNKPCIVLREKTEWTEMLKTGKTRLASSNYESIMQSFNELKRTSNLVFPNIFGDGKAAEFICSTILKNGSQRF